MNSDKFVLRNVWVSSWVLSFSLLGDALLYVVLPVNAEAFGVSMAMVGLLLSINRIIRTFTYGMVVRFAMRVGLKNTAIIGAITALLSTLGYAVLEGAAALVVLYVLQLGVSHVRARRRIAARTVDNRPILLMGDGGVLRRRNMVIARVTEDDLRTHLRGANVSDLAEIRAVVMEGTGTIHVLHGEHAQLDKPRPWILNNVWDYPDH